MLMDGRCGKRYPLSNRSSPLTLINPEKCSGERLAGELHFLARVNDQTVMKTLGIVVLVLGIIMTTVTGFTVRTEKDVVDLGPVKVQKEEVTPVYWSPLTGGILIAAGIAFVVASRRRRS